MANFLLLHLDSILQFVGVILSVSIGAGIIVWQMRRQHRDNLDLQKKNMEQQLHLDIYKELSAIIDELTNAMTKVETKTAIIALTLKAICFAKMKNYPFRLPNTITSKSLMDQQDNVSGLVPSLLKTLENYEIAIPNFADFRSNISGQWDSLSNIFTELFVEAGVFLPSGIEDTKSFNSPNVDEMKKIEELCTEYKTKSMEIGVHIADLKIEAQNNLLGFLFDHKLPPRNPSDPDVAVISPEKNPEKERPPGVL